MPNCSLNLMSGSNPTVFLPNKNNLNEEIGYFKYSFEHAQKLVEFADSKANILMGIHSLVFSFFSAAILAKSLNLASVVVGSDVTFAAHTLVKSDIFVIRMPCFCCK